MPILAVVGAAIGAEVIGGAIVAGLGLEAAGIGAAIAGAIGGAIGGALGGGVNSVMQGGDFWDGAKGGAIGGALGGAFTGIGGFEGIKGLVGGGDAASAATEGLSASSAIGASAEANPYALTTPGVTPSLAETASSAANSSPYSFSGASLGESAAGLGGPSLGGTLGGVVAGSAPAQGALGSSTGMKAVGQVGSQGSGAIDSLGKYFQGQDPMKLAGSVYDYYDKSQIANQARKSNAAIQSRYNALGNQIWDTGNSMLGTAASNANTTKDRINAVFAKYGMKGN
jgi:hypothetical protein